VHKRLVLALLALLASVSTSTATAAPPRVDGQLTFTRPDGTRLAFDDGIRIRCGPWEPGVPVRSIHVTVGSRASGSFWFLSAVLADVRRPTVVRLPNSFTFDEPEGALLFAVDRGENELSSAEEEASGRIVFERAGCRPKPHVRLRVDATLGSEFSDGEPVRVRGRIAVLAR
jgi:hypothetical protein